MEQKTKGGVGSLLARPHNLKRQVWLRKGAATYVYVHVAVSHDDRYVLHNWGE